MKRVIALVAAAVLATVGVLAVVIYARGAEDRAYAGAERVSVLVVTQAVPEGRAASQLRDSVEVRQVPRDVLAEGAVTDLAALGDDVTNAALVPGEQLVAGRFGSGDDGESDTDVPDGMQTIDLALDFPRVPADLKAGDRISVLGSYVDAESASQAGPTRMFLPNVKVLAVADATVTSAADQNAKTGLRLRLAVTPTQAAKLVNVIEFGKVYVSSLTEDETPKDPGAVLPKDVM